MSSESTLDASRDSPQAGAQVMATSPHSPDQAKKGDMDDVMSEATSVDGVAGVKEEKEDDGNVSGKESNGGRGTPAGNGSTGGSKRAAAQSDDNGYIKHESRKRRRPSTDSSESLTTKASESTPDDAHDDDDDDADDDQLLAGQDIDPDRLKSFNMFVRLFVDENLDRSVPISKQPKDKIQAIIDACDRQFPEFHSRARKRIRTYLKSCRRMRRSKDGTWDQVRPTPPHLTSAAAESILAIACENEANNAKRMRMGLEPLPAPPFTSSSASQLSSSAVGTTAGNSRPSSTPRQLASPVVSAVTPSKQPAPPAHSHMSPAHKMPATADYLPLPAAAAGGGGAFGVGMTTASNPLRDMSSPSPATNGNASGGLFRPGFSPAPPFHPQQHRRSPVAAHQQNSPTDLSVKRSMTSSKNQLNASEIATIKQLIAGYRESAAFLYRSADELEQLLLQHN